MNPLLWVLLSSWEWRPLVLLALLAAGSLYTAGWWKLRGQGGRRLASRKRLVSYWAGLAVLGISLFSAIDILGSQLFFMHMIQHLLMVMIAPPLLWLANPFPFWLWGLPAPARHAVGSHFAPGAPLRRGLRQLTRFGVVWIAFILVVVGWHDPNAYNLALRLQWVHDLEHLTFFAAAMLFWWHVIGAGPRIHGSHPAAMRIALLLLTIPPNVALGAYLAFADEVVYSHYATVPRIWQISVLDDQRLAGIIMWIPGSMMYMGAALVIIANLLGKEEAKPPLQPAAWATEEAMIAPGLEHRSRQNRWRCLQEPPRVEVQE